MQIKWSPQSSGKSNSITVVDNNTLEVDGEQYSFPTEIVQFDAAGPIIEAHRDSSGDLFVTVLRQYRGSSRPVWDDMQYHEAATGMVQ